MANGHGGSRPGAGRPRKNSTFEHSAFTPEQLSELLESPHVNSVTQKSVSYTIAFKDLFWQRYCDGVDPIQIFEEAGFRIGTLGRPRIFGLAKTLRKQYERGADWSEGGKPAKESGIPRTAVPPPPRKSKLTKDTINPMEIAQMYHKVAYMEQELEFIKKIILEERREK
jgi:hypothetical protein